MDYRKGSERLAEYRNQIAETRARMRELQSDLEPQPVEDHAFQTTNGAVRLSELFGGKDDLFVIHNMGKSCPYCSLWADGYNGTYDHLASRAAFVVASPDPPDAQLKFAASRGWRFPMVSDRDKRFAAAMGYVEDGRPVPGVSVFRRRNGAVVRVSDTRFSPGDDFCAVYHFLDLIPEGRGAWSPKLRYR
jgi:predicted dithiol-disulfide oxidoreductase (DUF899 family)